MDVTLHTPGAMTQADFLEWECLAAGRYEDVGRRPVAMTGGSPSHARIVTRLIRAVLHALDKDRVDMLTGAGAGVWAAECSIRMEWSCLSIRSGPPPGPAVLFEVLEPADRSPGPFD